MRHGEGCRNLILASRGSNVTKSAEANLFVIADRQFEDPSTRLDLAALIKALLSYGSALRAGKGAGRLPMPAAAAIW